MFSAISVYLVKLILRMGSCGAANSELAVKILTPLLDSATPIFYYGTDILVFGGHLPCAIDL